jgi:serine O-acetyltransferase
MFTLIKSDYLKYKKDGGNFLSIFFLTQSFWSILQYLVANFLFRTLKIPVLTLIRPSFYTGHFGFIFLYAKAFRGANCNSSQDISGSIEKSGDLILGNTIYIGANSVVVGKIIIGDTILIVTCTSVFIDALENFALLGVPVTISCKNSSKAYL